ncbi:hypothetical protein ABPG74_008825 [Tetrahymena malaccensis]
MSNQVEQISVEQHSKYVLEKVLVEINAGLASENISVKKQSPTAFKIEKLYCDSTKIISVVMPSKSESLFETDDEDEDLECSKSLQNENEDIDDVECHQNKKSNASCKERTSSPKQITNNLTNNLQKSVIKEVIKPNNLSEQDFKKEGGQYQLLHNEFLVSMMIPKHKNILKPYYFEEYNEGACLVMPFAAFGDADMLSKWQHNNFKSIQMYSFELHKLRCTSQSYEYQQPHIQEKIENQCEYLEKFIKDEIIQKQLGTCVNVIRVLAKQIGEALYFLHNKHDVAHNDIKPDNLYISEFNIKQNKYNFKLADFGYAKKGQFQSPKDSFEFFNRKNKRFFSPELLHLVDGQLDSTAQPIVDQKKCDVYALGLSLYEILVGGFFPFKDDLNDPLYIKYMNKTVSIKDLMQWYYQYFSQVTNAEQMIDLLSHMMDPNPSTRYSITQVLKHPWLKSFKLSSSKKQPILNSLSKFESDS